MFFLRIDDKIKNEIVKLKKGDEEDEEEDIDDDGYKEPAVDEIESILRFLQLFAEGHNLDLQVIFIFLTKNS